MQPVSEDLARIAVDRVVEACVESQKANGVPVPSATIAQEFARQVVRDTVAKQEAAPEKPKIAPPMPPDRLSRGEVGPDTQVINRPVSHEEIAKRKTQEDPRLRARLDFLGTIPEWETRIIGAALDGETAAKRMGIHTYDGRMSIVADFVINEVEKSNLLFGDWRLPPKPKDKPLIFHK